ncbi:methylmalonyl-CoA decarboxylase subunit delta [Thermococcus cleftensis]|uniref:Methylmalonyl-CoA decarboxylase subunit delta n=1 Tax=Thermococcus cleftensis (strain DSM 27260 / KACC 17922 / CL1) TaxID=163003 RepID=I3ZT27_THECF|nr:OadG family protein [Thermococcus cleftensis]AFL94861.1 methylmalonyl-CoA decarboxylase subunit delta [Thermococcus cleftensis]
MSEFMEGLNLTVLGVTIVFMVLSILAVVLYAVGWIERRLVEREKPAPSPAPTPSPVEKEDKPVIPPRDLAVITAAILAYTAEKASQLRPLPFKRKISDAWRLYGVQSQMEEVEDFNYEMGKW